MHGGENLGAVAGETFRLSGWIPALGMPGGFLGAGQFWRTYGRRGEDGRLRAIEEEREAMSMHDKCPKCQSAVQPNCLNAVVIQFQCGSMVDAGDGTWHDETTQCIVRQHDQLATKLAKLESTYAECAEKLHLAEQREHVLKRRFDAVVFERNTLADHVIEMEVWKESTMAVEREWNPNQLATMLGGNLGESQRAVIQRGVPKLLERVKRLEEAGDIMATWAPLDRVITWTKAKGQP